jgi:hypothetical protein
LFVKIHSGGPGADTILGAGGDDIILVSDNSDGDSVDCGENLFGVTDEDEVFCDSGDDISLTVR